MSGPAPAQGEDATILFVDDEPFESLVFTAALEGRFLEVRRVADAADALRLMRHRALASRLQLVISAHRRAGMSDSDFISELHRRVRAVPVLVLGADEDVVQDYPASEGLVVFLRKPVTVKRVVETAGRILNRTFRTMIQPAAL